MGGVLGSAFLGESSHHRESGIVCVSVFVGDSFPQDPCMHLWVSPEPLYLWNVWLFTLFVEGLLGP